MQRQIFSVVLFALFAVSGVAANKKPPRIAPNTCNFFDPRYGQCNFSLTATGTTLTASAYCYCAVPQAPHFTAFDVWQGRSLDLGTAQWSEVEYYVFKASVTVALPPGLYFCSASPGGTAVVLVPGQTRTSIAPPSFTAGLPSIVDVTVDPISPLTSIPVGQVTLREGPTTLATAMLMPGKARLTGPPLSAGRHTLTIDYAGYFNFSASSATLEYEVPPTPVRLSVTSSRPLSVYGEDVAFAIEADPAVSAPLTIMSGRTPVADVHAVNGSVTWSSNTLPAGPLSLHAICARDCTGISPAALIDVRPAAVALQATSAGAADGLTRITASVKSSSGAAVPEGTVNVREGDVTLASAVLEKGRTTIDVGALAGGEHRLAVRYSGDRNHSAAESIVVSEVRQPLVTAESIAVAEGNSGTKAAPINIRLSGASSRPIEVAWATADRSAAAGRDYVRRSGTLIFAPGEVAKGVEVEIIGNTTPEQEKVFAISITGPDNAAEALVHITNDDPFYTRRARIAYGPAPEQTLDLFVPITGKGPFPLIVGIEANSFIAPDREPAIIAREAERGYAVAALSFRSGDVAPFPAQIEDAESAVRWLRAHASDYAIDPNRIGAWGIGAGGHIAALLGTRAQGTARVQAVVDFYGEIDFSALDAEERYRRYLGCAALECPSVAAAANPTTYVTADDASMLMLYGAADRVVPPWTAQALSLALLRAGVDARLGVVDGAAHGGPEWSTPAVLEMVDRFFDEKLNVLR
jgi:acetyl esterase/lipase